MARMQLVVDDRTEEMSNSALTCRTYGHAWTPMPQGKKRRAELFRLGQTEFHLQCDRCPTTKTQLIDLDTFEVISIRMRYPAEGYLVPKTATGRLSRAEARKAAFARNI